MSRGRSSAGKAGGKLRIYFLQQWFNLTDPAVEEALNESRAMRAFVGIDLGCEPAPDETTVCAVPPWSATIRAASCSRRSAIIFRIRG